MIHVDQWVGVPLCALAYALNAPRRLLTRWLARPARPAQRILVMKFLGIGSMILATPMLRRLREAHPDATITFLTLRGHADVVGRLPFVDEVIEVPHGTLGRLLTSVPRLLLELRRRRFDLAIDLEFYSRLSALIAWGSGARRRIGFYVRGRWRGSLLTDTVFFNTRLPYGEAVRALLRPLDVDGDVDERLEPPQLTDDEAEAAWRRLVTLGVPQDGAVVVVNVNASDLCVERRWPADRFAQLVERFASEVAHVDRLVFIGAPSETEVVRAVLDQVDDEERPRCLDLSGRTTVAELTVLLGRAALVVTNDSGPLHLAASLDVPTASLFGPESPMLYGPVGDNHLIFYAGHWCSPCLSVYNAKIAWCEGDNVCMQSISVDEVVRRLGVFARERVGLAPPRPEARAPAPSPRADGASS